MLVTDMGELDELGLVIALVGLAICGGFVGLGIALARIERAIRELGRFR